MRKAVGGSNNVLGRKNRKNMIKQVERKPMSEVQTTTRRKALTGESFSALSTTLLLAAAEEPTVDGFAAAAAGFAGGVGFVVATGFGGGVGFSPSAVTGG